MRTATDRPGTGQACCAGPVRGGLEGAQAERAAAGLQLLAHPIRLRILDLLARHQGRVCVCDITATLPVKQPTISHHLRLLKEGGLVGDERRGQWAYYYLEPDRLAEVCRQFELLMAGWTAAPVEAPGTQREMRR